MGGVSGRIALVDVGNLQAVGELKPGQLMRMWNTLAGARGGRGLEADIARHVIQRILTPSFVALNSVSGVVSRIWCRVPFDQSEPYISRIPPTDSPTVRPGRDPWVNRPLISGRSA